VTAVRVTLCGQVAFGAADGRERPLTRPQLQLCAAALVLERHRPMTAGQLAEVLWGEDLSPHWSGALRGLLTRVRDALEAVGLERSALVAGNGVVQLVLPEDAHVDVEAARRATARAEACLADGDAHRAARAAAEAVAVFATGFLPAVDNPWVDSRRHELDVLHRRAARLLTEAQLGAGAVVDAVLTARSLVAADPFDDAAQILELEALAATGDADAEQRAYARHVRVLAHELGVSPSEAVQRRHLELHAALTPDPNPSRPATSDASPTPAANRATPPAHGGGTADEGSRRPRATAPWRPGPGTPPFVGRAAIRDRLAARLLTTTAGDLDRGLEVVVVEGEPGVGKTRLAAEVAQAASAAGARVLWGGCNPHAGLPFEPVAAALDGLVPDGADPATFVPRPVAEALGLVPPHRWEGTPTVDRPSAFGPVVDLFRALVDGPVLWVVDDLQWATSDSLALLSHTAGALMDRPITLLATCRDRPPEVAGVLAHLGRVAPLEVVALTGLGADAIDEWLSGEGIAGGAALADVVERRTAGNPLYVRHLVKGAQEAGGVLDPAIVPPGLEAYLRQRIDAVSTEARSVLVAVAVGGADLAVDELAAITALDAPSLVDATDEVLRSRLVEDTEAGLRPAHSLVEDVVVAGLGPTRRSWVHLRTAEVLARRPRVAGLAAALARHLAAAGPSHAGEARRWALTAAEEALDRGAWATADALASRLLADTVADPEHRASALTVRGRARRGLDDREGAEAALEEALDLARLHHLPRRLAAAVLAAVGGGGRGVPDHDRRRRATLVEEALAAISEGTEDDDLRIPLLGALAVSLLLTDRDDDRDRAARDALDLARRHGDPELLARALLDHRFRLGPDRIEQRLREVDEALALARAVELPEVVTASLVYRQEDLLVLGRRAEADATLGQAADHLADHPDPYWAWAVRTWWVLRQVLDGDLAAAEAAALDALGASDGGAEATACFGVNLVAVRMGEGRASEVVPLLERAVVENPHIPCYAAVLAFARAVSGDRSGARALLGRLAADGFAAVPHDTNRLLTLAMLAEVTVALGAVELAGPLGERLEPYAGCYVVLNCYGGGGTTWGPASAHLAALARLAGDPAGAAARQVRALDQARDVADRSWTARLGLLVTTEG
jgi:DNA-binding SARP family transcriptional activator